jgi:hypothetical protein
MRLTWKIWKWNDDQSEDQSAYITAKENKAEICIDNIIFKAADIFAFTLH